MATQIHPLKQTWFTWKWTFGKGDSYWKLSCPGSMFVLGGVFSIFIPKLGEDEPNLTSIFFKWVGSTTNQVTSKNKMLETPKPAVCTGAHKNWWFFPFRLVAKISGSSRQFSGVWKINSIQSFKKSPGFGVAKLWSAVELNESCPFFVQPSSKHGLVEEKRM